MLYICQPGAEPLLCRELQEAMEQTGCGWLRTAVETMPCEPVFAHLALYQPCCLRGTSFNGLAATVADWLLSSFRGSAVEDPWPFLTFTAGGVTGLGQRARGIADAVLERLRRRMGRVARLATPSLPPPRTHADGCFLFFADFETLWVARRAWVAGPRRMADDPAAPSRSYLKVEEAFCVCGLAPREGETVVDLGAAPGGWSYSAAQRGARVTAVDNGPLKHGAADHALIRHLRADAFTFQPPAGEVIDWLLCDLVEEPHHVLRLLEQWLAAGWCRHLVANLKYGRVAPVQLLANARATLGPYLAPCLLSHLYHDRDEITVMGKSRKGRP